LTTPGSESAPPGLIVYTRADCGYCLRLKGRLKKGAVSYEERPVEDDEEAVRFVESVNGGSTVVPTVVFADGHVATNPSWDEVAARLGRTA
jgi:mycoredoxin